MEINAPLLNARLCQLSERLRHRRYALVSALPMQAEPVSVVGVGRALLSGDWAARTAHPRRRLFEPSVWCHRDWARFRRQHPALFALFTLFALNRSADRATVSQCLGDELTAGLLADDVLRVFEDRVVSNVRILPYRDTLLMTDPEDRTIEDFAYLGKDSFELADAIEQRLGAQRFDRGLDLCTGVGIHAVLLADRCREVVGVDINPRALRYARYNALINDRRNIRFIRADLAEGLQGRFDVMVSNPPFRLLPETLRASHRDGFGGELGLEATLTILRSLDRLLREDGVGLVLTVSPVMAGKNRLLQVLADLVLERPFEIRVSVTDVTYDMTHHAFYRAQRISEFLTCHVLVPPSSAGRLVVEHRVPWKPLKQALIRARQWKTGS